MLGLLTCAASAAAPRVYHVSTAGSDDNPGTAAKPFLTVSKCVRAVEAKLRVLT